MGFKAEAGKLMLPAYIAYEIIKNTILPSNFTNTYAQENKECYKANSKWDGKTRQEKIDDLHHTNNRIMPLVEADSTGKLDDVITALLDGHLFTPATKEMTLNYGDTIALDLTNFFMKKDYASISFKGASLDEAFNFIYNGINKSYSAEKNVVMNRCQVTKNHKELERIVKMFEVVNPKWAEYIKDGKINDKEFKDLKKGIYVVEIIGRDKKGNAIERGYMFVTRGDDNTEKVKIIEKPVEVPVPFPVEVIRDTCITSPEDPCGFGVKNLTIGLGETIYDQQMPQARIGVGNCDVEGGLRIGYSGKRHTPEGWRFLGPHGVTDVHQEQEFLAGADITARIINNIRLGIGVNYRWNDFRVDEELYDHAGNLVKSKMGRKLEELNKEKNHLGYTAALSYNFGVIRIEGGMEFAKGYEPKKFVSIGVNF